MSETDEFAFIRWLRGRQSGPDPRLVIGIGDDAAAMQCPETGQCLIASDMILDGTHFTRPPATAGQIGYKALAVNLSDIAAMAGKPFAAFVNLALDRTSSDLQFARELLDGMQQLADEFEVAIAGGDTNTWNGPLAVAVTVVGEPTGTGSVRRNAAQPGDWIMTTGRFGGSIGGKHLAFRPRIQEAQALHAAVELHALIDVSDGLAADLFHILEESGTGAVVDAEAIPLNEAVQPTGGKSALEHALSDGEDFELLFTVSPQDGRRLLANPPVEVPLNHIGEITEEGSAELRYGDGTLHPLSPAGWQHRFG